MYSLLIEKILEMGSGYWFSEGLGKVVYVNDIRIIDGMGNFLYLEFYSFKEYEISVKCYRVMYVYENRDFWVRVFYYGGFVGCIG